MVEHGVLRRLPVVLALTSLAYVTFEMRAYDVQDREVGRSKVDTTETESGAKYVDFTFDERTPLMTAGHFELRATPK